MAKKPFVWAEQPTVISALRRCFKRYPPFHRAKNRCRVEWFKDCKNGNKARRVSFKCEKCKAIVPNKEFSIDHIAPVIDPLTGFIDYNTYAKRLFCTLDNLQGLCARCHKLKSSGENKIRRLNKLRLNKK